MEASGFALPNVYLWEKQKVLLDNINGLFFWTLHVDHCDGIWISKETTSLEYSDFVSGQSILEGMSQDDHVPAKFVTCLWPTQCPKGSCVCVCRIKNIRNENETLPPKPSYSLFVEMDGQCREYTWAKMFAVTPFRIFGSPSRELLFFSLKKKVLEEVGKRIPLFRALVVFFCCRAEICFNFREVSERLGRISMHARSAYFEDFTLGDNNSFYILK